MSNAYNVFKAFPLEVLQAGQGMGFTWTMARAMAPVLFKVYGNSQPPVKALEAWITWTVTRQNFKRKGAEVVDKPNEDELKAALRVLKVTGEYYDPAPAHALALVWFNAPKLDNNPPQPAITWEQGNEFGRVAPAPPAPFDYSQYQIT